MTTPRIRSDGVRRFTVCIDRYENEELSGCFYHPQLKQARRFQSTTRFLLEMEQVLNEVKFPDSFTALRTFAPAEDSAPGPMAHPPPEGRIATFTVRILFRQHASWQGSITWLEGRREQSFRSVLELLLLIHGAIGTQEIAS